MRQPRTYIRRGGFTLIEMIVVLAIIGIIGIAVVPSLVRPPAVDTAAAAAPVVEVLRAAQHAAADSGRAVRLDLDPATGHYIARLRTTDGDNPLATGTLALTNGTRMTADSARAVFLFDPTGPATGDSLLVSGSGRDIMVSVDRWTGDVYARTL
jgi:general secretion pathway protein H